MFKKMSVFVMAVLLSVSLVKTNVYAVKKGGLANSEVSILESKNDSKKNLLSLDEFNRKYSNNNDANLQKNNSLLSRSLELSETKSQTKDIICSETGEVLGSVTLEYKTCI